MNHWRFELRLLLRDRAAQVVLIGWIVLLAYAGHSGWSALQTLRADQTSFLETAASEHAAERERMAAVEAGEAPADPYVGFPSILRSPVVMPVPALAALDLGVLDRANLTLRVSLFSGPQQSAKGRELQSPLLLAAGRFDLGFVAIVLLPLALLALLFGQPGDDRGAGRLPLLAAQNAPATIYLQRYGVRLLALLLPLILISAATVIAAGGISALTGWSLWLAPLLGWALLWSGACALVGSRSASSATALAWLITLWVTLLWLLPAAVDTLATRLAPTPSALSLLGAERTAAQEAQRQREELFGAYVSDHPELSVKTTQDALAWTRSYYVQQRYIAEAMAVPRAAADAQHAEQRRLRSRLVWLSPAQALTAASEHSAGADLASLAQFLAEAESHKEAWDEALFRPLLAGRSLSTAELDRLPQFVAPAAEARAMPALVLLALHTLLALLLWRAARWRVLAASG
jgi:ABC-2 type transport system permease protein